MCVREVFDKIQSWSEAMKLRKIKQAIEPQYVMEGAGVRLRRSFSPSPQHHFDPFLLFDHFSFKDPIQGPISGFPTHPHRGIETVTYMLEGFTRHRDSLGTVDTIGPGDVQWMTAGRGILHEEMPQQDEHGHVDGFQLWVNLPAAEKMVPPRYQGVTTETIPVIEKDGVTVRVVAGEFEGTVGPVTEIAASPQYMDFTIAPGKELLLPIPEGHTAAAYLFEGEGVFGTDEQSEDMLIPAVHMLIFDEGDHIRVRATPDSHARFLLISGAPFKEPIFPYGPFVMNTREEIIQAFEELRTGTFVKDSAI
jgi:redox-sensitive bicupin YhaK (pirin superfamily)